MLPFHQFGRDIIRSRFEELNSVLTCANLTNYPSNSTGAYAWIKCAEGVDCVKLFEKVNLLTIPGDAFGGTSQCKTLCVDVLHVWLGPQAFKHFRFGIWEQGLPWLCHTCTTVLHTKQISINNCSLVLSFPTPNCKQ